MVRVAFILLCHKDSRSIIEQARRLAMAGDYVSIHFDAGGRSSDFRAIREALADNPNICFAKKRVKCGWGAWSLVQASLNALQAAVDAFCRCDAFLSDIRGLQNHQNRGICASFFGPTRS